MLSLLLRVLLGSLMFGLMEVWLRIRFSGSSSAGAGFSTGHSGRLWAERSWGHIDDGLQENMVLSLSCRGYCSVPGPLQSVQRAELWGVILALQASGGVHLGVGNLNVVRHVGRLLDGCFGARPFEILKDGDLLFLIHRLLCLRGFDTVRISKVKGHASEDMVVDGRVRDLDLLGNKAADQAADFGRRRVLVHVIDARRNLVGGCNRWYPVVRHLHRFFIAIARVVVNIDDGRGTAPDPSCLECWFFAQEARITHAVRDFAFLPGPLVFGLGIGFLLVLVVSLLRDVRVWPYSVSLLVKVLAFLGTLHWPAGSVEFGVGSVSSVELLILYEQWAGERLCLEAAIPKSRRVGRPISVSAVPFGPGIDIWRSCRFFGCYFSGLTYVAWRPW